MTKVKIESGMLMSVLVFQDEEHVGYGYVVVANDGGAYAPVMWSKEGTPLEFGKWYNILVQDNVGLVVIPMRKQ